MATLSGGNIQRVILARTLGVPAKFVVAAYPSRGLDIATTRRTQELLLEQRAAGAGVLFISEDLDELMELSDRIVVLHDGQGGRDRSTRRRSTGTRSASLMLGAADEHDSGVPHEPPYAAVSSRWTDAAPQLGGGLPPAVRRGAGDLRRLHRRPRAPTRSRLRRHGSLDVPDTPSRLGDVLIKASPLILAALAVAVPARAGLVNVGGEGQIVVGGRRRRRNCAGVRPVGARHGRGGPDDARRRPQRRAAWAGMAGVLRRALA